MATASCATRSWWPAVYGSRISTEAERARTTALVSVAWLSSSCLRSVMSTTTMAIPVTRPFTITGFRFASQEWTCSGSVVVGSDTSQLETASPVSMTCRKIGSSVGHSAGTTSATVRPICSSTLPPFVAASTGLMRTNRKSRSTYPKPDRRGGLQRVDDRRRLSRRPIGITKALFEAGPIGLSDHPVRELLTPSPMGCDDGAHIRDGGGPAASVRLGEVQATVGVPEQLLARRLEGIERGIADADRVISPPSDSAKALTIRSARVRALARSVIGRITANSSPPIRATASIDRLVCLMSAPAWTRAASPATWPRASLNDLKRSMSTISRLSACPCRRARSTSMLSSS